jgi:hypothetical protein
MSALSHSIPCASTFAHCGGVRRIERSTSFSSGGVGGRPRAGFGVSMWAIVVYFVVAQINACNAALLYYNKHTPTESSK